MISIRRASERGITDFGWLDSRHSFAFGDYRDPSHPSFRALRVINDDRISVGGGFPSHPHRDMEILTCVLTGELAHRDSMGNGTTIRPGEWQKMTAGTGVVHSEFNPSETEAVHLLQIWVMPDRKGRTPEYGQKLFPAEEKTGRWRTIASIDGRDDSLTVHQDMVLLATRLTAGELRTYTLAPKRAAWLHLINGSIHVNGHTLTAGDGLAIEDESTIRIEGIEAGEVLLFDLA